ncbi:MAG: hypothetical protein U0235_19445 [Polyangiaceae bacterium]
MRPSALRLLRAPGARGAPPRAPFGHAGFDDDARSIALEHDDDETLDAVAARLPHADTLTPGAAALFLAPKRPGLMARVLGARVGESPRTRAAHATALLARGYVAIEVTEDDTTGDALVVGHVRA